MKKYILLAVFAATMVACNSDFEEVNNRYEISEAKDEKKVDPNFLIHNDHYQKGKGETK